MIDVFSVINGTAVLTLTGLCWQMSRDKNSKYVPKETCSLIHRESGLKIDTTRNILENKIIELKDDIREIKADVKKLLLNGK